MNDQPDPTPSTVARALGLRLEPWQADIFDLVLERNTDGQLVHCLVTLTAPRTPRPTTGP